MDAGYDANWFPEQIGMELVRRSIAPAEIIRRLPKTVAELIANRVPCRRYGVLGLKIELGN